MIENIELMTSLCKFCTPAQEHCKILLFTGDKKHTTLSNMKLNNCSKKRPSSSKSPDAWRLSMPQGPKAPGTRWIEGFCCNSQDIRKSLNSGGRKHFLDIFTSSWYAKWWLQQLCGDKNYYHLAFPLGFAQYRISFQLQFMIHRCTWIPCAVATAEHDTQSFSLNWEVSRIQQGKM